MSDVVCVSMFIKIYWIFVILYKQYFMPGWIVFRDTHTLLWQAGLDIYTFALAICKTNIKGLHINSALMRRQFLGFIVFSLALLTLNCSLKLDFIDQGIFY